MKWLYAPGGPGKPYESKLFPDNTAAAEGWYESPADIPVDAPPLVNLLTAPPTVRQMVTEIDEILKRFYTAPTGPIVGRVNKMVSLDELAEVEDIERQRPDGPRQALMAAIERAKASLLPPPADQPQAPAEPVKVGD